MAPESPRSLVLIQVHYTSEEGRSFQLSARREVYGERPSPTELRDLTDDDLDTLRRDVLTEQERRARIKSIPAQIDTLTREYLDAGGDPEELPPRD
ncbi:hypothetical protein LQF12_02090 [Ruania suaedae]|uniref:hypothetical protein n=1 Tax=Ruania suaedae TaxID=2897774 RepID=UPI001E3EDEAF|nr:hypothetical protein [Ruania suaedae]UFU03422.1 hypothetical protein LQF12_02090 [Ruania suaedae]